MILSFDKIVVSSVKIPAMASLRAAFRLFPGTVDECADLLRAGNLLGIAPGGAYESLFGDNRCKASETFKVD